MITKRPPATNHKAARSARAAAVSPRVRVSEMQRARLLAAAVASIDELGYAHASVAHITARARVSRRTFYDLFDGREECLLAIVQSVVERIEAELGAAGLVGLPWRERVRGGLFTILAFCDREPALARVCVVQALQGGPKVLRRREEIVARLAAILDEGRTESARGTECADLTAEGLVGAAFAIVHARLSHSSTALPGRDVQPLSVLVGELMSLIVLPYLGPAAARAEQRRGMGTFSSGGDRPAGLKSPTRLADIAGDGSPARKVPMRSHVQDRGRAPGRRRDPGGEQPAYRRAGRHLRPGADLQALGARLLRIGLLANTGQGARQRGAQRLVHSHPARGARRPTAEFGHSC